MLTLLPRQKDLVLVAGFTADPDLEVLVAGLYRNINTADIPRVSISTLVEGTKASETIAATLSSNAEALRGYLHEYAELPDPPQGRISPTEAARLAVARRLDGNS